MEDPRNTASSITTVMSGIRTRMWAAAVQVDIAPIRGSARWAPLRPAHHHHSNRAHRHQVADPQEASRPPSGSARPIVVGPNQTAATTTTASPTELVASGPRWDGSGLAEASRRWSGSRLRR